jgi:zinc protease
MNRLVPLAVVAIVAACGGTRPGPATPTPPPAEPAAAAATPAEPAPAPVPVPVAPATAAKIRTIEGITEYRLGNGLQVLLFPDPTQSTVTINITYLVGSRLEGYGETGMAHLLEHMMFKGSPRHRNVLKLLEAKGGQANGSTSYDRTNYFETLPASQANLDWALDLEADRMIHAEVSADDLKTEFSVVRNEFEGGENDPENILDERISETAFLWHNYGKPTIGSRADIERVPVPALRAFYENYYQPDDAVLIVSGKFDEPAALASIGRTFGMIPKPARALGTSYSVEPVQDGERVVTLRRTGDVSVVSLAYHTVAGTSPDFSAVSAAADILTREPSGRLYKKLVETKLAAVVRGGAQPLHDPYLAEFSAEIRDPKNVDKVEQIMLAEIEGLGTSKIDAKELERWRTSELKEIELAMANSQLVAVFLSEFIALGDWRTLFAMRDQIRKVQVADVQRVAKTFFKRSNRTLGRFLPTKAPDRAPLTEAPNVAELVKGITGGEVKEQGEVFAATLDHIDARTTRATLAGGIKAAFLAKKTRGGKVVLRLRLHWGDAKALQNRSTAASMMGALMTRGTTKKTYQDLTDLEDQLKARLWIQSEAGGLTVNIETVRDNLPAVLALAGEMLTSPSFPDKELELVRQESLAQLEQQRKDPWALSFAELGHLTTRWPKSDPRYPEAPDESIAAMKKVRVADVRKFYKDFAGAGHGELAVVGDFDPKAIGGEVEKLVAAWQTKKPYARLDGKVFDLPGVQTSIDIKDKEQTVVGMSFDVAMRDTDADYPAWLMAAQILGGGTGSRLWMRLREHEGLSYGVQTWAFAGSLDDAGGFGGYAIVAPQNLAKAKASILDEFGKMAAGAPDAKELQHAKDTWIKDQDTSLSDDSYVLGMLTNELYRGRTTAFTKELRAKIQAVTAADVARVANKYYHLERLTIVDAGDRAKAK